MKINKIQNNPALNSTRENEKKANPKAKPTTNGVNVEISKSAKELIDRINQVESGTYSEKVEKIRTAFLEGTYPVEPEKIAQKMIESMDQEKGNVE